MFQKADMTNNALVPLESRAKYIDFTTPFKYYTQDVFYYQDRKSAPSTLVILLSPFQVISSAYFSSGFKPPGHRGPFLPIEASEMQC